jgi:DNA-binding NarL/FixJ family response regulator
MTIRVLVADDQAMVRAGFRMIIDSQPDLTVTAEAADGSEAVRLTQHHAPDVVLMDIQMPELDGIAATRQITAADRAAKVVILTTYDLDEYVFDALAAGASGYVLKDLPPEDLLRGIRTAAAGDALLAPSVTRRLIAEFAHHHRPRRKPGPPESPLTPREVEVLTLVASGQSNAEIAATLTLSENTVKTHVTHVLDKLLLRDRIHAVIYAYEHGIVTPTS